MEAVHLTVNRLSFVAALPLVLASCGSGEAAPQVAGSDTARICDSAGARAACVEVTDADAVQELRAAFTSGPTGGDVCPNVDQQVWRIVFTGTDGHRAVDVPYVCGPTVNSGYEVTDAERDLLLRVRAAA